MESVSNLIELLKSQLALYTEVRDVLVSEKEALIEWKFDDTNHITKHKDSLTHKERILEQARKSLADRVCKEYSASDPTLSAIIEVCPNEKHRETLIIIREQLAEIAMSIHTETIALKMLYATNIRLVNDFYGQAGLTPTDKYGSEKRGSIPSISTIG